METNNKSYINDTLKGNDTNFEENTLAELFGIGNDTKKKLEQIMNPELNSIELQLAKMFGDKTYNRMLDLASRQDENYNQPKSFASAIGEAEGNIVERLYA